MSESIELGIGGNNDGFLAALKDSEQKAEQSSKRVSKSLNDGAKKGAQGMKSELDGIAGDFSKVTSGAGALDLALGKIGGGLKMAGTVALIAGIGKAIYDATQSAQEFDRMFQKIERSNVAGVANVSASGLDSNLATIKAEREKNMAGADGIFGAVGTYAKDFAANVGANFTGDKVRSFEEIADQPGERDAAFRKEEEKALARIAEKSREVFKITQERVSGNKEAAELMQIEADYAEKIQAAIKLQNPELQKQLGIERESATLAAKRRQETEEELRGRARVNAGIGARQSGQSATMSPEAAQREKNKDAEFLAQGDINEAANRSRRLPGDKAAANEVAIAEQGLVKVKADNAKWERDIARAKSDSLKITESEISAMDAQMRGQSLKASLIKQQAQNQREVTQAERDGKSELAAQLRLKGQMIEKQTILNAITGADGRVKSVGQIRAEARASEKLAAKNKRKLDRLEDNDYLSDIQRDISGKIISGRDIRTGDYRQANAEMGYAQGSAKSQARSERVRKQIDEQKEARMNSGTATGDEALNYIAGTMRKWDSE